MNNVDREGLLQLFMASLPAAVTLLDVDGNVRTWSAGAQDITGYAADEIEGRHFSCLYTLGDVAAGSPATALQRALAQGRHEETGQRVRRDGSVVKVHTRIMPLHDSNGELVGYSSLMRDVSVPVRAAPEMARILVVDDDEQLREGVSEQLISLGYSPVLASNGREALDVMAREPHIDLLFTDVVMPGMNGREVAEEARLMQPDLKVLFTSGYFEGALLRNGKLDANVQLLTKPYRKQKLAEKVEEALRSTA
jgi:PAS domain S-box-containing protein